MLSEHCLERSTIDTAGISQRLVDVIPECLLEPTGGELLAAQLPVGVGRDRVGIRLQPVLGENLVVELAQSLGPARVLLECLARQLVVVDDGDVCVDVLTVGVIVDDHHVLGAEGSSGELLGDVNSARDVAGLLDVELLRVEREDEVVWILRSVGAAVPLVGEVCLSKLTSWRD